MSRNTTDHMVILGAPKPPKTSWWTDAAQTDFTARCWTEWERMKERPNKGRRDEDQQAD